MNHEPILSFITVTFNFAPPQWERSFIEMVRTMPPQFEWLIWDNDSSVDRWKSLLNQLGSQQGMPQDQWIRLNSQVRIFRSSSNAGFATGCNQSAKVASASALFFLNPDTHFKPESWLVIQRLVRELQSNESRVIQPVVVREGTDEIDTFGEKIFQGGGVIKFCEGMNTSELKQRWTSLEEEFDRGVVGPSGAAFLITKACFEEENGFDSSFFLLKEDTDFALRLLNRGIRTKPCPELFIAHHVSLNIRNLGALKIFLVVRNSLRVFFKNASIRDLLFQGPAFITQTLLLVAFHSIVNRHPKAALKGVGAGLWGGLSRMNATGRLMRWESIDLPSPFEPWLKKVKVLLHRR